MKKPPDLFLDFNTLRIVNRPRRLPRVACARCARMVVVRGDGTPRAHKCRHGQPCEPAAHLGPLCERCAPFAAANRLTR